MEDERRGAWRGRLAGRERALALAAFGLVVTVGIVLSGGGGNRGPDLFVPGPSKDGKIKRSRAAARESAGIDRALWITPYITRGSPRKREIALTFDDGPGPYTPKLLRVLRRTRTPATFFIIGQQLHEFRRGLRQEVRGGFAFGNHTQNHPWMPRLGWRAQRYQITDSAKLARAMGVPASRLYRPPYGAWDATTLSVLRHLRMLMVLWSVDTRDFAQPGTRALVTGVLGSVAPGAIVLLHDAGGARRQTIAALPAIIRGLRRRHYKLVTVSQMLADAPPPRRHPLPRELRMKP